MKNLRLSTLAVLLMIGFSSAFGDEPSVVVIAGNGTNSNDEQRYETNTPRGVAVGLPIGNPFGVEPLGDDLLITTVSDHCVWKLDRATGQIERIAGNGLRGYSGDGSLATEASFDWPHEVRCDNDGNLYIADTRNHVIRRVAAATGIVTTIGGTGNAGYGGDDGPAKEALLNQPHSVVLDHFGGVLVADTLNHRLRRIDLTTGMVATVAGTGEKKLPRDGQQASTAPLFGPRSLAVDSHSIWIALREGNSIWRIDRAAGTIHHVAGSGKKGYSSDGVSSLEATFNGPKGLAIDGDGNLIVSDTENNAIRHVDLNKKVVTTLMGGLASAATTSLARPHGITVDLQGVVIVGDSENHRVLEYRNKQ